MLLKWIISTFLRYVPETAEKYRKIEGKFTVLPAVQSKKVEIIIGAKKPYFRANLGVGSQFCPLRGQKRSKSKKFFFPVLAILAKVIGACTIVGAEKVVLNFHTFFHTFSWYYLEKGVEKAHQKAHQNHTLFRDGTPIKKLLKNHTKITPKTTP